MSERHPQGLMTDLDHLADNITARKQSIPLNHVIGLCNGLPMPGVKQIAQQAMTNQLLPGVPEHHDITWKINGLAYCNDLFSIGDHRLHAIAIDEQGQS